MKKIFLSASVFASLLFAASCQQENLEPVSDSGNTVTYTVQVPETMKTKAIGDNIDGTYQLTYEVYRASEVETDAQPFYEGTEAFTGNTATVSLQFVKDQDYVVLFWANTTESADLYNTTDLRKVSINNSWTANDVNAAAFAGIDNVSDCVSASKGNVSLVRPVSQINIATSNESLAIKGNDITLVSSSATVKGLSPVYNVYNKEVSGNDIDIAYSTINVPREEFGTVNGTTYTYVAMNYVGFAVETGTTVDVEFAFDITENNNTVNIKHSVPNVPIKPNYRTNILGNLISEEHSYTVTLDTEWTDVNGGNMEFVTDGLVKNLDGAYEVSTEKGLAYAMNELFAKGGDFYLTKAEYDMTDYAVTAPVIPEGVQLNIYGETPVVTRASATTAGITITGIDMIIGTIENGATVYISGVHLTDAGAALVDTNNGTLVVSDSSAEKIVANGEEPVDANNVTSVEMLNAALATDVKEINITGDFEASEAIMIGRSVVINGNDHKITSSATRVFRVNANEVEVVINDLDVVSTAVRVETNDVRGISIDANLSNISLTLNDCSVDFTDASANDWAYAVNVSGNGTGHKLTVNGGAYEGANVINVNGANNTVTVKGAVLNSTYPEIEAYFGACIWVLQEQGSSVYAEGNTFNAYNAKALSLGTGTALEEKNNVDNTMFYYNGGKCYYVSSAEKLQYAVDNVKKSSVIRLYNDIEGDVTILQKEGIDIVIDGEGLKYDGTITIDGNNRNAGTETLTIKNIHFETETPRQFVSAPGSLNGKNERYSHNITVEDCSFYTPSYNEDISAIGTQKTYHFAVKGCSAENMHSLLQVQSCDNDVTVENVTVTNCKNGISFGNTAYATLKGAEINAKAYGVRGDGKDNRGKLVIENATITAKQPVIVRKMTTKYSVDFVGDNTLTATEGYQVIFTNGDDEAEYVKPTGTFTVTGADNFKMYPQKPVAKIGDTEYGDIDAAIAKWSANSTLTLLDNVTLTDVITLKSTEHHILNLSTYTMTAAEGKNAIEIKACGTGDAERSAITIKADANNPGGINAGSKSVIYYDYSKGEATGNDRPIIKIEGGVFGGATSTFGTNAGIYAKGSAARKCATINISGGEFNCSIYGPSKSKVLISGGVFHKSVSSQGDQTAYRLISGGRFKTLGFMTADSNNTKFWIGTSMNNSNVGVYVDDENYLVVGGPVITDFGDKFAAKATNATKWSSYLQYSSAATNGLYYTNAQAAISKHGEANVVRK